MHACVYLYFKFCEIIFWARSPVIQWETCSNGHTGTHFSTIEVVCDIAGCRKVVFLLEGLKCMLKAVHHD